ncbi:carbohydrate-binding wsc [Trichoderma arundinaceum]|uniref:Carbohydrate-binding wsc n=1 Tax=Trichoderma arundinaceum TaxID=490622 RepID=A0A395NPH8_TRIAR|nr:carbohydrate-binding wsc [Trichoderma arundinaceum]
MSRLAFLASLMAASVAAQAEFAAPGFKYIGCVEAEPRVFGYNADIHAPFSAQQCQTACHGKGRYVALDGGCHCHDHASNADTKLYYKKIDDSVCSLPCIGGNSTTGRCGGPQCPETGKKRYSLYQKDEDHHGDGDYDNCGEEDEGEWSDPKDNGKGSGSKDGGKWDGSKDEGKWSDPKDDGKWSGSKDDGKWNDPKDGGKWDGSKDEGKWNDPKDDGKWDGSKDGGKWDGFKTKAISLTTTTTKTITSCPPEVTDCPLKPTKAPIHCPGDGCHVLTTAQPPPPFTKHHDWSTDPTVPVCDGEHCKPTSPTPSACPHGGCVKIVTDPAQTHPRPTNDPHDPSAPTKVPVIVSEGARYFQSGVLIAVTALAMAFGWL